jgi:RNA polymerase sigma factor (sigma-70 family)
MIAKMETALDASQTSDSALVLASLTGNREAFERIVARYQTLICSLAYSGTGNISLSEDLAQETFIAAWKQLATLREPQKLRSWLCGIARNRIYDALKKQGREPSHAAEPLDAVHESPAPELPPLNLAMSKEEEAILWRAIERIPETYREPLILYYREHQSVEAVAANLELSEDAVKQRLSRGRKLLHEQVLSFVEGALARTSPGNAFTLGVLAALPITLASSAKAATLAAAAKGGATVTGTSIASVVLGILTGPMLGFFAAFLGWRESFKNTRTVRERRLVKRFGLGIVAGGIIFFAACFLFSGYLSPRLWRYHPALALAVAWAMIMSWAVFAFGFSWWYQREFRRLREETRQQDPELFRDEPSQSQEYRSRATLFGLPLVHCRSFNRLRRPGERVQPAIGWIAIGEHAYGVLYASGGVAVGGIASGGLSIGVLSFGGASIGLLAFGGLAIGLVALGGGAIGLIASGGLALGWHAAMGGLVAAHELACGGAALGNHVNDAIAQAFFARHRWLDFTHPATMRVFWLLCFGPMFIQMVVWIWWRRRMARKVLTKVTIT